MNRIENFDGEMIDLGAVSVETKGGDSVVPSDTDHTGSDPTGISND